jgi:hypothetical protein
MSVLYEWIGNLDRCILGLSKRMNHYLVIQSFVLHKADKIVNAKLYIGSSHYY